jgi:hypothetical protein
MEPKHAPQRWLDEGYQGLALFRQTGDPAEGRAAVRLLTVHLGVLPEASPDRCEPLTALGEGFGRLHQCTGNLAYLDAAITAFSDAVQLSPSDHARYPDHAFGLGVSQNG